MARLIMATTPATPRPGITRLAPAALLLVVVVPVVVVDYRHPQRASLALLTPMSSSWHCC